MSASFRLLRNSLTFARPILNRQILRRNQISFVGISFLRQKLKAGQKCNSQNLFISAGILGMLGFKDQDEEDAPQTDEEKLIHSIKLGILAMQQGDFAKSEYLLHIALKMAQDLQHDNGIYYVYTVLADLAFKQGDFRKCERLYIDVMKRELGRGVPQNANSMVEMSLKLAQSFVHREEKEKAEQGFRFCIDTQEEKIKGGVINDGEDMEDVMGLWGMSRDWYGQFLLSEGRNAEALTQFQEAYDTCCKVYGETHPQALVLLNSLGTVSSLMGNEDQAINYFGKAVKLGRETESDDLATFLVNLGMSKIKQGLKIEAEAACKEAYGLAKKNKAEEEMKEAEICIELVKTSSGKKQ